MHSPDAALHASCHITISRPCSIRHLSVRLTKLIIMMLRSNYSMGVFAGNNGLEALLSRIAEQHQPMFVPTAPETRAGLPRLQVPTPSQAAAAAHTAPSVRDSSAPAAGAANAAAGAGDQQQRQGQGQQQQQRHAACKVGDACTVCHDEYEAGATVVQLPCCHCFHEDCIMPWLEQVCSSVFSRRMRVIAYTACTVFAHCGTCYFNASPAAGTAVTSIDALIDKAKQCTDFC